MARDRNSNSSRRKTEAMDSKFKKRVSILDQESITYVDYKDLNLLRRFMSERAKIRGQQVTGNSAKQQRDIARAIRVAREMGLLPYAVRQITQRTKSRRPEREGTLRLPDSTPLERIDPNIDPYAAEAAAHADALDEAVAEEIVEEIVAEIVAEEIVEEVVAEIVAEEIVEEIIAEAVVEEIVEEIIAEAVAESEST